MRGVLAQTLRASDLLAKILKRFSKDFNRSHRILRHSGAAPKDVKQIQSIPRDWEEAQNILNKIRKERALPVIEKYQWIAAATAFANPVPALDLLATAAINTQLVVDLSAIYEQKFSIEKGKQVAGTMAELMLKLGLVELSTKTLTTLLKSNSLTFVAGGAFQAVSAAYLTRVAGMSLVEYLTTQADTNSVNIDQLGTIIQGVFSKTQENNFLKSFVTQVMSHILPQGKQLEFVSSPAQ